MGHIINATAFRLGHSKKAKNIWVKKNPIYQSFFIKDLYIFQFIKFFFMVYNIPVFSTEVIRNKDTGNDDIFNNPWVTHSFGFSSCKITRSTYLGIFCIFLDSLLEEQRTQFLFSNQPFSYIRFRKYREKLFFNLHYTAKVRSIIHSPEKLKKIREKKKDEFYYNHNTRKYEKKKPFRIWLANRVRHRYLKKKFNIIKHRYS